MSVSLATIKNKMIDLIEQEFNQANGYSIDCGVGSVKEFYDNAAMAAMLDTDYPKVFVLVEGGQNTYLPTRMLSVEVSLAVVFILKTINQTDAPMTTRIAQLSDDFHSFLSKHYTLDGLVSRAEITEYNTDAGTAYPEGIVAFDVAVGYVNSHE